MKFEGTKMKKKYQSEVMEAIHEEAQALFEAGAIDEKRMTEYDQACFLSKPNTPSIVANPAIPAKGKLSAAPAYARQR
jgi:DNA-binding transcriptional regulator YiaG